MTRTIPLKIQNEYIAGDKVLIGAAGSHNDVVLRMEFSPMWDGLAKTVQFCDALGESTVEVLLAAQMLENGTTNVYRVPVPNGAKKYAGDMAFSIKGAEASGGKEARATTAVYGTFTVGESKWSSKAEAEADVPPTQAAQMQTQIDAILGTIQDAREAANDARASANAAEATEKRVSEVIVRTPVIVNGYWYVWDDNVRGYIETNIKAEGQDGVCVPTGGLFGTGVSEDGHLLVYYAGDTPPALTVNDAGHLIFTLENGNVIDIGRVMGPAGPIGEPGGKGDPGVPGKTPVKGVDYFTEVDKQEIVDAVLAALPDGTEVSY